MKPIVGNARFIVGDFNGAVRIHRKRDFFVPAGNGGIGKPFGIAAGTLVGAYFKNGVRARQ